MALTSFRIERAGLDQIRVGRWLDLAAPLLILAVGLPMRLANIGSYSGKGDEGIRGEQLLLMAHGYRPVKDIFASQGPLSLDIFYPFFAALGGTLAGARLAVVVYSLLTILAVFWLARLVAGRAAGWSAAALLLLSPTFLKNSRLALVEVPAMLPATLALGAAVAYQRDGRRRWLVLSALGLAVALAIKPMMIPAVPAIGLALLLRRGAGPADLAWYTAVAAGTLSAVVLLVGPMELYDQVVRYRVGSRQVEGWSLSDNWSMLSGELRWDQPAFFALAAFGGVLVAVAAPRAGLPVVAWVVASFGLLLVYSPLGTKHAAILPPGCAALAGIGLGLAWRLVSSGAETGRFGRAWQRTLAAAGGAVLLSYLVSLPTVLARDRQAMSVGDLGSDPPYREESALIQSLTGASDFILVDDPYLAFLNQRLMPPSLVDTSIYRIRSGALSGGDVVEAAERHDVRLMLLLSDNLRELEAFADWADERFVVVKINERSNRKDRALYLRSDVDLGAAREALRAVTSAAQPIDTEFAGQLRVRSFSLEPASVRPGGETSLTLEWEATAPMSVDWHPITVLRDANGNVVGQSERSLGGGSGGTATWAPGRWVYRTSTVSIPRRAAPGEYTVGLGLYDSKARRMATISAGQGAGSEEVRLGTIHVR